MCCPRCSRVHSLLQRTYQAALIHPTKERLPPPARSVNPGSRVAQMSSGSKLSSGQNSRGIYGEERQTERRIMSRERHQNVVDTVSNKRRCWKALWTKDPGSYSAWQPVLLWQSTFSPGSATQAVRSTRTRGQSAPHAFFYTALNAVRSISVIYCYSIKFYLVKVMIYLLHLAEQTCALSHLSTPLPDS